MASELARPARAGCKAVPSIFVLWITATLSAV